MKRALPLLLTVVLALSALMTPVCASTGGSAPETPTMPDWVITEIANDTTGEGKALTNGYATGADVFEFIELCNTSGKTLNLYDYAVTYNGHNRGENFENKIVESTPIKGGDYLDGSTLIPTDGSVYVDISTRPQNPAACEVAPGEVVVLWFIFYDAYYSHFNNGTALTFDDFRAYWGMDSDTTVIAIDACTTAKKGGNAQNFNIKNKDTGTYGIAKWSEALDAATNTPDCEGLVGAYTDSTDLVCWATMDFKDLLYSGSQADATYHFTWDFGGYTTHDQTYIYDDREPYTYDARRGYILSVYDIPSPGSLSVLQKMTLGLELEAGESFEFINDGTLYYPYLDFDFKGYLVNDTLYKSGETFTADKAGVYAFDYLFVDPNATEAPTEAPTEPVTEPATEAPTEPTTEAPTAPVTEAPTEAPTTPADDSTAEALSETSAAPTDEGCASLAAMAILPLLLGAAWLSRKARGH